MKEHYKGMRSHFCGELRIDDAGGEVILMGWVASRRDHGGLVFVDLRDRYGVTQVVFSPEMGEEFETAGRLSAEDVLRVEGSVRERPAESANQEIPTGEIEVNATSLEILSEAKTPPFEIKTAVETSEDLRLEHRYLDLRRKPLQRNLITRHEFYMAVRKHMASKGFIEVETPVLTKSTPEGARDFLVPSRLHKGKFYALPQSPQIYKQILMVSGFDKYFQIVKAFRDEDLRADRQPEHTQIDIEMSFVEERHVMEMAENLMVATFKDVLGVDLPLPFPVLKYNEAMGRYGSDKPEIRFGVELRDVSHWAERTEFNIFRETVEGGGSLLCIMAPAGGAFSRKVTDELAEYVKRFGLKGIFTANVQDGALTGGVSKYFPEGSHGEFIAEMEAGDGDVVFFAADEIATAHRGLGALRLEIGRRLGLKPSEGFSPLWVTDFPMFDHDEETGQFMAMHHPFTSPMPEDLHLLEEKPGDVRARAYDMVINGNELGGGSIRINRADVQTRVFKALGIGEAEAEMKFGFLLRALSYGAPPHGGIAFGLDRIVMVMLGLDSIRDVIAFPKTSSASALMEKAPSEVSDEQLRELGIRTEPSSSE